MDNSSLPLSSKRRSQGVEIIDAQESRVGDQDKFKQDITLKVVDSLPKMLEIAESIVEIRRMQKDFEGQILLLREQGDNLIKEADAFVKRETAQRDTFREKANRVQDLLRDLYLHLNQANSSDEVKKVVIETVNNSIEKILASEKND